MRADNPLPIPQQASLPHPRPINTCFVPIPQLFSQSPQDQITFPHLTIIRSWERSSALYRDTPVYRRLSSNLVYAVCRLPYWVPLPRFITSSFPHFRNIIATANRLPRCTHHCQPLLCPNVFPWLNVLLFISVLGFLISIQ